MFGTDTLEAKPIDYGTVPRRIPELSGMLKAERNGGEDRERQRSTSSTAWVNVDNSVISTVAEPPFNI